MGKCRVFHLPFSSVVHRDLPKCSDTALTKCSCTFVSLLWKWMIQIGKAGPLQSFELIYCIFKRDREQIWRKQTLQHVVAAGGDCWGTAACSEPDLQRLECRSRAVPRSVRQFGGADVCAVSCGISLWGSGSCAWSQPLDSITAKERSVRDRGGCRNRAVPWFDGKVFARGRDSGRAIPSHPWGACGGARQNSPIFQSPCERSV